MGTTKPVKGYAFMLSFEKHLKIVESCETEIALESTWFPELIRNFFDVTLHEIHHQKRNPKGIQDIAIYKEGRCRIAIELKKPKLSKPLIDSFQQAWRYPQAFLNPRKGLTVYPLGILTNGKEAILFDPGYDDYEIAQSKSILLDLIQEDGYNRFIDILDKISKNQLGHFLHRPPIKDLRPEDSLDGRLRKKCQKMIRDLNAEIKDKYITFNYWVQLFLIAILRDNGIIPNDILKQYERNKNINGLTNELNRILHDNFEPFELQYNDLIWKLYKQTSLFPTRLNLCTADTLGATYEYILKTLSSDLESTSVYTPEDLAKELILKVNPNKKDKILDPAAGSGTLLCIASEIAWEGFNYKTDSIKSLTNFFEKNLFAIDRDDLALRCCKTMLLSTYVKILDIEPVDLGKNWQLPKIKNCFNDDLFFKSKIKDKISMIVGNPPWGNIHAQDNPCRLNKEHFLLFKKMHKVIYHDESDLCGYVLKHIFDQKLCDFEKDNLRIAFLMKQQILTNMSNKPFRKWAEENNFQMYNHGEVKRFIQCSTPRVAEAIYIENIKPDKFEIPLDNIENLNVGIPISEFVFASNGFQPSKRKEYIKIASRLNEFIKENKLDQYLKPVYPSVPEGILPIFWDVDNATNIFYLPRGIPLPFSSNYLLKSEKNELLERKGLAKNYPYSWRGCEKLSLYGNDLSAPRIFMPKNPRTRSGKKRTIAAIDIHGRGIGTTGQSILIKKPNVSLIDFKCIVGWLNSTYFLKQLKSAGITIDDGGYRLESNEIYKLKIPEQVFCEEMLAVVDKVLQAKCITKSDLSKIDAICESKIIENDRNLEKAG